RPPTRSLLPYTTLFRSNLFYHLGIDAELQLASSHSFGGMEPPSTGLTGLLEDVSDLDNLPEPEPLAYGESLKIPIGSNTANNLQDRKSTRLNSSHVKIS